MNGHVIRVSGYLDLTITWMSMANIKDLRGKLRLHVPVNLFISWIMATMLRDFVVVVGTRLRAIPLAMIIIRKVIRGFSSLSYMSMVPR